MLQWPDYGSLKGVDIPSLITPSNIAFYSLNCILAGLNNRKGEEAIGLLTTTLTQRTTRAVTLYNSSS